MKLSSESLLPLNQFELMRSLFYTDESAVDCYVTQFAFPISTTTRFVTEKQRIAFPITEISLCPIANVGKFTVNVAVDVPLKITDDDVRRFPASILPKANSPPNAFVPVRGVRILTAKRLPSCPKVKLRWVMSFENEIIRAGPLWSRLSVVTRHASVNWLLA